MDVKKLAIIFGALIIIGVLATNISIRSQPTGKTHVEISECIPVTTTNIDSFPRVVCSNNRLYAEIPVALHMKHYTLQEVNRKVVLTIEGKDPHISCIRDVNITLSPDVQQIILQRKETGEANAQPYLAIDLTTCNIIPMSTCPRIKHH